MNTGGFKNRGRDKGTDRWRWTQIDGDGHTHSQNHQSRTPMIEYWWLYKQGEARAQTDGDRHTHTNTPAYSPP